MIDWFSVYVSDLSRATHKRRAKKIMKKLKTKTKVAPTSDVVAPLMYFTFEFCLIFAIDTAAACLERTLIYTHICSLRCSCRASYN